MGRDQQIVRTQELAKQHDCSHARRGDHCTCAAFQRSQRISELAKTDGYDLIVLATHGYTGLKHVLLGSTAERVVRFAPCAVLVVKATPK